jgi:hypothetical protein
VLYAEYVLSRNSQQSPQWLCQSWLNHTTRRIGALVRLVQRSSWMQSSHMADLMQVLNKSGYRRMVLSCWRYLRARGLDADTAAWAQTGNAMIYLEKKRAARALLADWRTRKGVQMWMLGNYIIALPRLTQAARDEVIATCHEGLATLAHDHCARYLVYMEAEAYALNRDKPGLLAIWESYARYFNGSPDKTEFFPQWQRYLMHDIPRAVRLLSEPGEPGYGRLLFRLRRMRLWNPSTRKRLRRIIVLVLRLTLLGLASGGALIRLFS